MYSSHVSKTTFLRALRRYGPSLSSSSTTSSEIFFLFGPRGGPRYYYDQVVNLPFQVQNSNVNSTKSFSTTATTTTGHKDDKNERHILMESIIHPDFPERQITRLILNRPKAANAMGMTLLNQLEESLEQIEQQQQQQSTDTQIRSRCVVITSTSSKVFSAGADLKERKKMTIEEAEHFVTRLRNTFQRVAELSIPVICAIEGVAVGGGLELALACDIRIVGINAQLGFPETSLAIVPGAGGTQRLSRLIGVSRAKELIWTGRRLSSMEALEYGIVNKVVIPKDDGHTTEQEAMDIAWKIATNGPIAIQASKDAIDQGLLADTMKDALEIERQCYRRTLLSKDRLEGLASFQEGRPPHYKGI